MDLGSACFNALLLSAVLLLLLLVHVVHRRFTILQRYGIPGPTPYPLVGIIIQFLRSKTGFKDIDQELFKKYGRVNGYYFGRAMNINVTDVDILKHVLVKDFSNFTNRTMFSELERCANTLAENFLKRADEGKPVPVKDLFGAFTMDAIACTAFGIQINSQNEPDDPFVRHVVPIFIPRNIFRRLPFILAAIIPGVSILLRVFKIAIFPKESCDFFSRMGQSLIEDRKKNPTRKTDFLQLLLNAELEENSFDEQKEGKESTKRLTTEEINSQAFLFFIAGYETTASLLRYAAYELALHPEIDQKLVQEIREQVGESELTHDKLSELKYMDQFVNETLRFYPPFARFNRRVTNTATYGPYTFPAGATVNVNAYQIHHDPEYYEDPDVFDPDRFSPERKSTINPITFLPFGCGPRNCIGMRLALVEAKIALVKILQKVQFVRCSETVVPLKLKILGLLIPNDPVLVRVERRQ
ncbi:hypothetical protein CHS0354_006698 [Potamilus streckersoni]|uniref:Cytochrome P450 n=1 Tax=Potamilus streckersoni TaxID=2493646 RepID=A0AAE0VIJ8_9BIVA|nr:hypothetical protein CHS0354_006698 [Potamilus streckersoni]